MCHTCYAYWHAAPDCILQYHEIAQIMLNYEALTPEEVARIPAQSYARAKVLIQVGGEKPRADSAIAWY